MIENFKLMCFNRWFYADYLLCHDDKSDDRLIAFIFYLNSTWKPEWGGSLDIFDHDGRLFSSFAIYVLYIFSFLFFAKYYFR